MHSLLGHTLNKDIIGVTIMMKHGLKTSWRRLQLTALMDSYFWLNDTILLGMVLFMSMDLKKGSLRHSSNYFFFLLHKRPLKST